jgi:hypothetical protein
MLEVSKKAGGAALAVRTRPIQGETSAFASGRRAPFVRLIEAFRVRKSETQTVRGLCYGDHWSTAEPQ